MLVFQSLTSNLLRLTSDSVEFSESGYYGADTRLDTDRLLSRRAHVSADQVLRPKVPPAVQRMPKVHVDLFLHSLCDRRGSR